MRGRSEGLIESQEAWERRFAMAGASERARMSAAKADLRGLERALRDGGEAGKACGSGPSAWGELWGFSGAWAVSGDRLGCALALLRAGADVNERRASDAGSALHAAARRGAWEEAELLLGAGALPEAQDRSGATALIALAKEPVGGALAEAGRLSAARALLRCGANAGALDSEGKSALMWAAERGREEVGRALLEAGADWRVRSRSGESAASLAAPGALGSRLRALAESDELRQAAGAARAAGGKAL